MTKCGKIRRCCTLLWYTFLALLIPAYITLFVFSGIAVNEYRHVNPIDQCDFSPEQLGGYFAGSYLCQSVCIILTIVAYCIYAEYKKLVTDNEAKAKEILNDSYFIFLWTALPGTPLIPVATIFLKNTVLSQCFQDMYAGTYVMTVIYVCLGISIPYYIVAAVVDIVILVFLIYGIVRGVIGFYTNKEITFQEKVFVTTIVVSIAGFIVWIVSAAISDNYYRINNKHNFNGPNCQVAPEGLGWLFFGMLATTGVILIYLLSMTGCMVWASDIDRQSKPDDGCVIFGLVLSVIIAPGYSVLIWEFSRYTMFDNCFASNYSNTFLMRTCMATFTVASVFCIVCIIAAIYSTSCLVSKGCCVAYKFVMTDDPEDTTINPRDIVNTVNNDIVVAVAETDSCENQNNNIIKENTVIDNTDRV